MCQVSWCCTYLEGFKDVSFTSWWYWGRVSLPPSPTKLLRNTHISTVFPLVQLFVSAEEDTKLTSHVLLCKNELWNAVTRLELFSVYLVPKSWTDGLNLVGYSETSSCFQCWGQTWKQQPEFRCWNKVINNVWVLTFSSLWGEGWLVWAAHHSWMTQAKPSEGVSSLWIFHQTHCCYFCCKDRVLYSSLSHPISPQATWGFSWLSTAGSEFYSYITQIIWLEAAECCVLLWQNLQLYFYTER